MIMMFIDTTKCVGCKACQVACKQWHSLPAETTTFTGSYTNPTNYSGSTLTFVKFTEFKRNGKLNWLIFKNQCMHCIRPKCQRACPRGVERTMDGYIIFNEDCTPANVRAPYASLTEACPFGVPKLNSSGRYVKCDLCFDRFGSADTTSYKRDSTTKKATTACELTCPAGAIVTGTDTYIRALARARLVVVKNNPAGIIQGNRYACLYSGNRGRTSVIYLLSERPRSYGLGLP